MADAKDLSFWKMAAMGIFVKAVMWGRKEATMYSYNGVVLPKLPEWDKEKYPYAELGITGLDGIDFYYLNLSSLRPFVRDNAVVYENGIPFKAYTWITKNTNNLTWIDVGVITFPEGWKDSYIGNPIPFWTNFDLLNEDGTLYMAKSDPIPVYK